MIGKRVDRRGGAVNIIYSINDKINSIVWGPYMIFLLVGVGIFLTVRLKVFSSLNSDT